MKARIIRSEIIVAVPKDLAFGVFFPFDYLEVFRNLWFVPAFECPIVKEHQCRPGFGHAIYFDNGNKAFHQLNTYLPETSFSAVICSFDSGARTISSIDYNCSFFEHTDGCCRVSCEYHFLFGWGFCALFFDLCCRSMIDRNLHALLNTAAAKCLESKPN